MEIVKYNMYSNLNMLSKLCKYSTNKALYYLSKISFYYTACILLIHSTILQNAFILNNI